MPALRACECGYSLRYRIREDRRSRRGGIAGTPPLRCLNPRKLLFGDLHVLRLEGAFEPGLAVDAFIGLEDLELPVGLGLTDVDVLGQVHIGLRLHRAAGAGEAEAALELLAHRV